MTVWGYIKNTHCGTRICVAYIHTWRGKGTVPIFLHKENIFGNKKAWEFEETITVTIITSHLKATRAECQSKHGWGRRISGAATVLSFLRSPKKTISKSSEVRTRGPLVPDSLAQPKPQPRSRHEYRDAPNAKDLGVSPCKGRGSLWRLSLCFKILWIFYVILQLCLL